MEQYAHKDLTFDIFRSVLLEPEFRDWADVGIVAQAYLPETEGDLRSLADWARERGTPVTVRLVKGAYWDYEVLHARQIGWPVPVFLQKWETDASFERCARFLMEHHERLRPALGSHNVRSLAHAMAAAEAFGVPEDGYEVQTLHGMGESIQRALVERGQRVRVYTPYGAMLPGMAYLVRRLLENTSNESFLKANVRRGCPGRRPAAGPRGGGSHVGPDQTPRGRAGRGRAAGLLAAVPQRAADRLHPARGPRGDARAPSRKSGASSGDSIRSGWAIARSRSRRSSPRPTRAIPRWWWAGSHARGRSRPSLAVSSAREAFGPWSRTPPAERAAVLVRAAEIMRRRRFDLAAWEVYECGKPWREADGDVAEAIDFCEFYAREMIRPGRAPAPRRARRDQRHRADRARGGRGHPPLEFPAGDPDRHDRRRPGHRQHRGAQAQRAVARDGRRSWRTSSARPASLPACSPSCPASATLGRALVEHPEVDLIAFTGSRDVGLEINRRAAETSPGQDHVKRVIAEMGGKNAIIVDDDADLDEAVVGVLQSAFGYAGQKCSACSRVDRPRRRVRRLPARAWSRPPAP